MKKFEYWVTVIDLKYSLLEPTLNSVGEDGWELVFLIPCTYNDNAVKCIFKREKK